ncbi:MAG: hypothetical protein DRN96_09955, partial [Thermoproteota archaeon]
MKHQLMLLMLLPLAGMQPAVKIIYSCVPGVVCAGCVFYVYTVLQSFEDSNTSITLSIVLCHGLTATIAAE